MSTVCPAVRCPDTSCQVIEIYVRDQVNSRSLLTKASEVLTIGHLRNDQHKYHELVACTDSPPKVGGFVITALSARVGYIRGYQICGIKRFSVRFYK